MITVGTGWVPTRPRRNDLLVGASTLRDGPLSCATLDPFVRRGGNQMHTNSCVHWGFAGAVWALCGVLGVRRMWPSVMGGYYSARARAQGGKGPFTDRGCTVPDSAAVYQELGWIPDDLWPFAPRVINYRPPLDALLRCRSRAWLRPFRVIATGIYRAKAIRRALSAQRPLPVLRATRVDDMYLAWRPGDLPWVFQGPLVGMHLELVPSYDETGIMRVSSWGDHDRIESWESIERDPHAETWIVDADVDALRQFAAQLPRG